MTRPGPAPTGLARLIAEAIEQADTSVFREDYGKQARAVILALRKAGYEIAPADPPAAMVEEAAEQLPSGRLNKYEFVRALHQTLMRLSRRYV
jgi:hypothetical protein